MQGSCLPLLWRRDSLGSGRLLLVLQPRAALRTLGVHCLVCGASQCGLTATSPSETGSPLCTSLSRCSPSAPGQLSYSTASLEDIWSFKQKIWAVCLNVSLKTGVLRWSLWLGQFCANSHLTGFGRKHNQKQAVKKQRCCQMKLGETFFVILCSCSKLHLCTCKSGSLFVFLTLSLLHTENAPSAFLVVAHFLPLPLLPATSALHPSCMEENFVCHLKVQLSSLFTYFWT